ncbi:MAG TPA: hypothetical protein VH109_12590 [Steroidobacteraceae bacterium]|nr:hypothetical protein [Steroidobacteraceae bacterium]
MKGTFLARARGLVGVGLLIGLAGCSLISLKSPERPLSTRDANARVLTRQYSSYFIVTVERCADAISAEDEQAASNALRWKIAAVSESERAATQMSPMMSLLDTWTFSLQMRDFLAAGAPGAALFGIQQDKAQLAALGLAEDADALARKVIPAAEFERYNNFAQQYVREHPLQSLSFVRPSVVVLWSRDTGADVKLVDTLGTIPEAMGNAGDTMKIFAENVPPLTMWKAELALREAGYSKGDVHAALAQLDQRLGRLSAVAQDAPELVHGAVADVRESVDEIVARLDAVSGALIRELSVERAALAEDVRGEREAAVAAINSQRQAIAADAGRLAHEIVQSSGEQVRILAREMILLSLLLFVVILGVPFAAGYYVGRVRHRRPPPQA